jgi:hypothetical protein
MMNDADVLPNANDVIFGRGKSVNAWPGNVSFRHIVWAHRAEYQLTPRQQKKTVTQAVVNTITAQGGRFLQVESDGRYKVVLRSRALEKASQALREINMMKPEGCIEKPKLPTARVATKMKKCTNKANTTCTLAARAPVDASGTVQQWTVTDFELPSNLLEMRQLGTYMQHETNIGALQEDERRNNNAEAKAAVPSVLDLCRKDIGASGGITDIPLLGLDQGVMPNPPLLDVTERVRKIQDSFDLGSAITNNDANRVPQLPAFEARPSQFGPAIKATNNNARPLIPPHLQLFFQAISSTAQKESCLRGYASSVAESRSGITYNDDREELDSPVTVINNDADPSSSELIQTLSVLLTDAEGVEDSGEMDFEPLDAWFAFSTGQPQADLSEWQGF